jgi:hypothetical protein
VKKLYLADEFFNVVNSEAYMAQPPKWPAGGGLLKALGGLLSRQIFIIFTF